MHTDTDPSTTQFTSARSGIWVIEAIFTTLAGQLMRWAIPPTADAAGDTNLSQPRGARAEFAFGCVRRDLESIAPDTDPIVSFRRGCSSMVEQQPSKLMTRVRFPSPAPNVPTPTKKQVAGCRSARPAGSLLGGAGRPQATKPTAPLASKGAAHQTEVEASVWVAPLDTGAPRFCFSAPLDGRVAPRIQVRDGYCLQRWPLLRAKLRSSAAMTDGQPERERLLTDRAR
jgi:hypothetical protein